MNTEVKLLTAIDNREKALDAMVAAEKQVREASDAFDLCEEELVRVMLALGYRDKRCVVDGQMYRLVDDAVGPKLRLTVSGVEDLVIINRSAKNGKPV